jgi:hypothetical protein
MILYCKEQKMAKRIKVPLSLFNVDTAQAVVDRLMTELDRYSFVSTRISTLGGNDNVTIMLAVSTESKGNWLNGIFENSNYRRFSIENDGTVENFTTSGLDKVRKFTAKSVDDLITRLNK